MRSRIARELVAQARLGRRRRRPTRGARRVYDADELLGVVPADDREPLDMREVIARLVDGSDFLEFKPGYGADTLCGHARDRRPCRSASSATTARSTPAGANKAAHFIQLLLPAGTPLVYLQNTTGYMVGTDAERGGMIKHGAKMIQAVANARVPQFTVQCGGSFGAGNYGMCGRGFDPRFIFSWPNARTAVMGGAAGRRRRWRSSTRGKLGAQRARRSTTTRCARWARSCASASTREIARAVRHRAAVLDDGVIDPRDTRRVLALVPGHCARGRARARCEPMQFGVARL